MFLGCGGHHTDDTLRQAAHEKISKFRKMKAVFWNQSKAILMCLGIFFRGPLALKMNQLRAAFALWGSPPEPPSEPSEEGESSDGGSVGLPLECSGLGCSGLDCSWLEWSGVSWAEEYWARV
jgi:hypothetical protein